MMLKLKMWLFKWGESKKLTERQRLVAYKDAYEVQNFKDILVAQNEVQQKQIALKSDDPKDIWFRRGIIYQNQNLLKRMKRSHELWILEQESELKRQNNNKI